MLTFKNGERNVHDFVRLFETKQLNLEPGFQRDSVWSHTDRRKLIESILQQYPIPSVFLYERQDDRGRVVYDVIDGKQRLETILMFQGVKGFRGQRFSVRARIPSDDEPREWDWRLIERRRLQPLLDSFDIQTVEVQGDLSDIIDLFVRINSTGKRLTGQERRNARFYKNPFLKDARRIADRYADYFSRHRILSAGQVSRMKHIELVAEVMASVHAGGLINKKAALDNIIGSATFDGRSLPRIVEATKRVLNRTERMFPKLKETRFANSADFYSLVMLVSKMEHDGLILTDAQRNAQAQKLLIWLSVGVALVRDQVRKAEGARADQRLFRDYMLTIQGDTDSQANRRRRDELLREVLGGLFERKDTRRGFTREQRLLIWHSDERKRCTSCNNPLSWENFTIDHVNPWSRGGRTSSRNAALMCRSCNSRKGNQSPRKRVAASRKR